jgi:aspartyl-tRNA(Asn)/glutamyl-tRNA(Gln) amidotransferase subunit C
MISKEDIKNLADLSRIQLSPEEMESMTREIDSILGYVGQIQDVGGTDEREVPAHRNIMREDRVINESGEYTEKLLDNAPGREGNYLKVKKIL